MAPIPDAKPDWKLDPVEANDDTDAGDAAPPPGAWGIAEAGEVPAPNPPNPPIDPICDGSPDPKLGMRAPPPPDPSPLPPPPGPKLVGMNGVCPGCGNKSVCVASPAGLTKEGGLPSPGVTSLWVPSVLSPGFASVWVPSL
ncbi:hypothetical protein PJN26_11520 [Mycobacterium kansasii]